MESAGHLCEMLKAAIGLLVALLLAGCAPADDSGPVGRSALGSTAKDQSACEERLLSEAGVPPRLIPSSVLSPRWRIRPGEWVANVIGLDWIPEQKRLVAFDMRLGQVVVFDTLGMTQLKFGRLGNGPGEFAFVPSRWSGNRLAALPQGFIVADGRGVHYYDEYGTFQSTLKRYRTPLIGSFDVHLAHSSERLIVSESGKGDLSSDDQDTRTALSVRKVVPRQDQTWSDIAALRNSWITLPEFEGLPAQRPYRDSHRRTWDADGEVLVALSYERYGVCFLDLSAGVRSSFVVDLPRQRIDRPERERELRRHYSDPDVRLPFLGVSQRQLFEGKWPEHTPMYVDVVLGSDSVAWALRLGADSANADLYHARTGYLGSLALTHGRLPTVIRGGLAWLSQTDSLGIESFIALELPSTWPGGERR